MSQEIEHIYLWLNVCTGHDMLSILPKHRHSTTAVDIHSCRDVSPHQIPRCRQCHAILRLLSEIYTVSHVLWCIVKTTAMIEYAPACDTQAQTSHNKEIENCQLKYDAIWEKFNRRQLKRKQAFYDQERPKWLLSSNRSNCRLHLEQWFFYVPSVRKAQVAGPQ